MLIGGESAIAAKKHTSESIQIISEGGVAYGIADGKKESYEAVRIHLALRNYTCDELQSLLNSYSNQDIIQRDVVRILKTLMVKKNLLLFLPNAITVEGDNDEESIEIVKSIIEDCFGSAFEFRKKIVPSKETFFCVIHNQVMLFFQCEGGSLNLVDSVSTYYSDTFRMLSRYYDLQHGVINAIINRNHFWEKP